MVKITLDGLDYDTEDFSDNGKAQLASLQFLGIHVRRLQAEIAVYKTAHNTYIGALKAEIAKAEEE